MLVCFWSIVFVLGVQQAAVVSVFSIKLIAPVALTHDKSYLQSCTVGVYTNVVAAGAASSIIQQK
jgi:hypothetical protein